MKQLSTEEKARRYDEALERARELSKSISGAQYGTIFPELKEESEDEKIRKELIRFVKGYFPNETSEQRKAYLAWLEKQSLANKEYWRGYREGKKEILDKYDEPEKQGEHKPVDKIKPKFDVGDKIQYSKGCGTIMTIEKIENGEYVFANNMCHTTIEWGNEWYLVEQKPVDIIPKEFEKYVEQLLSLSDGEGHGSPAKVKEVSLKLLKLAKIEQNLAWSEADEQMLEAVLYDGENAIGERHKEWLKGLKYRVQPNQSKSGEDKKHIETISLILEDKKKEQTQWGASVLDEEIAWLKSLHPQNHWKPTEEQMEALNSLLLKGEITKIGQAPCLQSLYYNLKAL